MNSETLGNFDWDMYEGDYKGGPQLIPNHSINGSSDKLKCFSREPYAQRLFDIYTNQDFELVKKDLKIGDVVRIQDIFNVKDTFIDIELAGGLTITVDLLREKKFVQVFGYNNVKQFTDTLRNPEIVKEFLSKNISVYIIEATPSVKISLWQGYLKSIRDEFMCQIENPTQAYKAKIIEANKGGFFVEVQGVEAFMPGSLAAPNKILDFQSYIGKEIVVMIEDYLKEMNSFIVSHKKYLAHVIPIKIAQLDLSKKYVGTITGTSKFGIFIEFEELFTGLLHTSKMDIETREKFNSRLFKPNDIVEFYISEITKDNRIILTKESPEEKLNKIQNFIVNFKDKIIEASVAAVMNFGIIVNTTEGISGLIPSRELKRSKIMANNFVTGDKINVIFDTFYDDKIVFKIPVK
jgi:predicted RNA-binding protein (virulence factor B family)